MANNMREKRWHWLMILLWAYSVLWIGTMVVVSVFFPSIVISTPPISVNDSIITGALFIPVLVFILIVGRNNLK